MVYMPPVPGFVNGIFGEGEVNLLFYEHGQYVAAKGDRPLFFIDTCINL